MVSEQEDKRFAMSIPGHESDRNFMEGIEIKCSENKKRHPKNIAELRVICIEEWIKISTESCKRLVVNYKKRLDAVIANNGHATKY